MQLAESAVAAGRTANAADLFERAGEASHARDLWVRLARSAEGRGDVRRADELWKRARGDGLDAEERKRIARGLEDNGRSGARFGSGSRRATTRPRPRPRTAWRQPRLMKLPASRLGANGNSLEKLGTRLGTVNVLEQLGQERPRSMRRHIAGEAPCVLGRTRGGEREPRRRAMRLRLHFWQMAAIRMPGGSSIRSGAILSYGPLAANRRAL